MADAITSTGGTAAAAASTGKTPSKGIAENFDSFLMLLTTQLKNQSPLDPLDTNQFTQQLVQFASVEQQLKSNETRSRPSRRRSRPRRPRPRRASSACRSRPTARRRGSRTAAPMGAEPRPATRARPRSPSSDKNGSVVATRTSALTAGAQTFTWDGKTSTGTTAPDGDYTITVAALDSAGQGPCRSRPKSPAGSTRST